MKFIVVWVRNIVCRQRWMVVYLLLRVSGSLLGGGSRWAWVGVYLACMTRWMEE